jgi:hypothetical protein
MGEMRKTWKIFVIFKGRDQLGDLGVDGRVIQECDS